MDKTFQEGEYRNQGRRSYQSKGHDSRQDLDNQSHGSYQGQGQRDQHENSQRDRYCKSAQYEDDEETEPLDSFGDAVERQVFSMRLN